MWEKFLKHANFILDSKRVCGPVEILKKKSVQKGGYNAAKEFNDSNKLSIGDKDISLDDAIYGFGRFTDVNEFYTELLLNKDVIIKQTNIDYIGKNEFKKEFKNKFKDELSFFKKYLDDTPYDFAKIQNIIIDRLYMDSIHDKVLLTKGTNEIYCTQTHSDMDISLGVKDDIFIFEGKANIFIGGETYLNVKNVKLDNVCYNKFNTPLYGVNDLEDYKLDSECTKILKDLIKFNG